MQPPYNLRMVMRGLFLQRNRMMPEHSGQFANASHRGSSSSTYQPRPTCGQTLLWMGVRAGIAATTAVVSQTTRQKSAGCGIRIL